MTLPSCLQKEAVTAARALVDSVCGGDVPLCVLHDFDSAGIIIKDTLENDTRRYSYTSPPNVIDFGLHYSDINGLSSERNNSSISDERLSRAGLDQAAICFLRNQRVELNAMTSRQLIDFVEDKLKQHGIGKVIPDSKTLAKTYEIFAASDRLSEAFEQLKEERADEREEPIKIPKNLEAKVESQFRKHPDISWHRAIQLLIDPDALEDEDDEEDEDHEDLSDIDE